MCANLLGGVRAGYSYGISNYDQWGCDISTRLGVPVHQYDCFDTRQPACPTGQTRFHAECIGASGTDESGRVFDTLANQLAKNGDGGKNVVVKMDVEGAEWDTILLAPPEVLQQIDQLVLEMHGVHEEKYLNAVGRLNEFFYVANVHFNNYTCQGDLEPFPAWAYEVLFVNRRLAVPDPSAQPAVPHPLDRPNSATRADCQAWIR
jgi:hypothetical protein